MNMIGSLHIKSQINHFEKVNVKFLCSDLRFRDASFLMTLKRL